MFAVAMVGTALRAFAHPTDYRGHLRMTDRECGSARTARYFFSPFLVLSSTFKSGLDLVALASRSTRFRGVA